MDFDEPEADRQGDTGPEAGDGETGLIDPSGSVEAHGESGGQEGTPGDPAAPHTALPTRVEAWRKRSAAGAILTGFALGLQEALETRRDEPSIVVQTSGDPPDDLPVEADFEYGRPRQSVVSIRPWLLGDSSAKRSEPDTDTSGGDPAGRP